MDWRPNERVYSGLGMVAVVAVEVAVAAVFTDPGALALGSVVVLPEWAGLALGLVGSEVAAEVSSAVCLGTISVPTPRANAVLGLCLVAVKTKDWKTTSRQDEEGD